jgi:SAM-dependent methyltransferase
VSHPEQVAFCRSVRDRWPALFRRKVVLDIGSLDINGSNRELFEACFYLGVDRGPGRNVDWVGPAHTLGLPALSVDVVVSTEALEHDRDWRLTLSWALAVLRPGGLLLLTCAAPERPEHGTHSHEGWASPYTQDYYHGLGVAEVAEVLRPELFYRSSLETHGHDLQFWGVKR